MKNIARGLLAGLGILTLAACASADSIQPIVNTKQVLYGSAQKTITSNSDVTIDTQTHQLSAQQNIKTNRLVFNDGTVITSSSTLGGTTAWGAITGTLSNQTDLNTRLVNIGVSTAALSASTTTLGTSVSTLQGQVVNLAASTTSLQSQVNTLSVSTAALQTNIDAVSGVLGSVIVSTGQLQAQINNLSPVSLSTGVTGILQPANLVSTIAYITGGQTFIGQQSFASPQNTAFAYGISAGSAAVRNLTGSQFVTTDVSKNLTSYDLFGSSNFWVGQQTMESTAGLYVSFGVNAGSITLNGLPGTGPLRGGPSVMVSTGPTDLASEVTGILPVANGGSGSSSPSLINGTNVTISGSWPNQTISATGGNGGTLGVYSQDVSVSSPTSALNTNASLKVILQGSSTAQFQADPSSVTLQGNSFNAANGLVQLSAGSQLPAVDGNLLTDINAGALNGTVPSAALTNAILSQSTLQTGATFYTSSGTVTNLNTGTLKFSDGTTQTSAATNPTNYIINQNTLQSGATFYVSSGTVQSLTASTMTFGNSVIFPANSTNIFLGDGALNNRTSGTTFNIAIGNDALFDAANNLSQGNVAIGDHALTNTTISEGNTGIGYQALNSATSGSYYNTAVGFQANATSGSSCTFIGANSGAATGINDSIAIGYNAIVTSSNTAVIGAIGTSNAVNVVMSSASIGGFVNPIFNGVPAIGIVQRTGYEIAAATSTTAYPNFAVGGGFLQLGTPHGGVLPVIQLNPGNTNPSAGGGYITLDGAFSSAMTIASVAGVALIDGFGGAKPIYASRSSFGTNWGNYENFTNPGFDTNVSSIFENDVQIGSTTTGNLANSQMMIMGSTAQTYELAIGTTSATTQFHVAVSTNGHMVTSGPAPAISSCGTTPSGSVVGDDNQGTITVGGGSVTACTLTFANSWGTTPVCVISDNSTAITGDISSISATAFTSSFSLSLGGGKLYYQCGCTGTSCR